MLPGFNTNVRHRGVLFHVQSEDSGRAHPHVITHLYHGGTILFSEKSSYAGFLDAVDLPARVRELMESQHRAVLTKLRKGSFDDSIKERLGAVLEDRETPSSTRPSNTAPLEEPTEPPAAHVADTEPAGLAEDVARPFGDSVVSAKPLDEVILDYLVENARKRRQKPAS
jgi:hypothetical protein